MEKMNRPRLRNRKGEWFQLHPLSGVAILLLDNFFFGWTALTGLLALPVSMALAFWTTFGAVLLIQRIGIGDSRRMSLAKGFITGLIAGLPFSIAGTILGGWVLLSAGLSSRNRTS